MPPAKLATLLPLILFAGMMACLEIGYRIGRRNSAELPELSHEGTGVIEAAIFALLGLLLGFSFAGGTTRLDARRELIVREANAIGTAYLRVDLLPQSDQPKMRHLFRDYLDARLRVYEKLPNLDATDQELERASQIQQQIWSQAITYAASDPSQNVARLLLPALNDMIDVTTDRTVALHTHLPTLIFFLLVSVALLSALLAGYAMEKRKRRSLFHMILYAGVIAITVYAILDLDNPRTGQIRLGAADHVLVKLRDSIR
jgi:hypothetical protein